MKREESRWRSNEKLCRSLPEERGKVSFPLLKTIRAVEKRII